MHSKLHLLSREKYNRSNSKSYFLCEDIKGESYKIAVIIDNDSEEESSIIFEIEKGDNWKEFQRIIHPTAMNLIKNTHGIYENDINYYLIVDKEDNIFDLENSDILEMLGNILIE
jgi:hypothetical protein